jgi:hypothetical protein
VEEGWKKGVVREGRGRRVGTGGGGEGRGVGVGKGRVAGNFDKCGPCNEHPLERKIVRLCIILSILGRHRLPN